MGGAAQRLSSGQGAEVLQFKSQKDPLENPKVADAGEWSLNDRSHHNISIGAGILEAAERVQ
eukprot:7194901-Karenia_brevis.AAC.1